MSIHNIGIAKFNSPPNHSIKSTDLTDKVILVIAANSGFGTRIVEELQNSNVRVLTTINSGTKFSSDFLLNLFNEKRLP
jgi:hypothetical protein